MDRVIKIQDLIAFLLVARSNLNGISSRNLKRLAIAIFLSIIALFSVTSVKAQIDSIANGESMATVREKLNTLIYDYNKHAFDTVNVDTGYISVSGNLIVDLSSTVISKRTISGNIDSLDFTGGFEGVQYYLYVKIDATGGYTFNGVNYNNIITTGNISLIMPATANDMHRYAIRKLGTQYLVEPIYDVE